MSRGKIHRPEDYKHLLWRRHPDSRSFEGCRPEIIASDGAHVRRLVSQHQHISFQAFEDRDAARDVTQKIEASVASGVALLGYSMFNQHEAVAILHTADGLEPGWVAFPHRRSSDSSVPTLPMRVADLPKLRLIGGAEVNRSGGELQLEGILEQRGSAFLESDDAFSIIDHIKNWEVWGRVGRGDEAKNLRLMKRKAEPEIGKSGDLRLAGRFVLDEVIWGEFENRPDFKVWFVVNFDRELFCLPDEWLRFWLQVEL